MVRIRRTVLVLTAIGALLLGPVTVVHAQDPAPPTANSDRGTSTTYGFDQTCNQVHDTVSKVPGLGSLGDVLSGACKAGNAATHPDDASNATKSKIWDTTFGQVTQTLLDGLGQALAWALTFWIQLPNGKLLDSQTLWQRIDAYTRVLQIWLLAFSIAVSAVRVGAARKHLAADHAEETFKVLLRSTATTWIAGTVILSASRMTDAFSSWMVSTTIGQNAGGTAELFVKNMEHSIGLLAPGFVFVVAIVGLLGGLATIATTVLRQAFLVVAVAVFPLAAAASGMGAGRNSYQRLSGWIIAFLLYKPCAALVYLVAFTTADVSNSESSYVASQDSAMRALIGLILLCSTAAVLPALARLVLPALAALGSGGSGAAATGMALGLGVAGFTGGKALMVRGAAAGAAAQARSTGSSGGPPPPGPNGGSGHPRLPPAPPTPLLGSSDGGGGGGAPSSPRPGKRVTRALPAATGAGRGAERAADQTAGGTQPGTSTSARWVNSNPNLGSNRIDG